MNIIRPRYYLPITYAIARNAACWQLNHPRPQVGDFLASLESYHADLCSNA